MRLNPTLRLHKIGKHYMIVHNCAGNTNLATVYTLNSTAAWLWQMAQGKEFTAQTLADMLCDEYEVTPHKALADIETLLEKWSRYGLLLP